MLKPYRNPMHAGVLEVHAQPGGRGRQRGVECRVGQPRARPLPHRSRGQRGAAGAHHRPHAPRLPGVPVIMCIRLWPREHCVSETCLLHVAQDMLRRPGDRQSPQQDIVQLYSMAFILCCLAGSALGCHKHMACFGVGHVRNVLPRKLPGVYIMHIFQRYRMGVRG